MNENEETLNPDSVKELARSLFLINGVHKKLEDEREHITTAVSQMTFVSKEFEDYSQKITEKMDNLDLLIQDILSKEIRNVSKGIAEEASRSLVESLTSQLDVAVKKLRQTSTQCENKLYQSSEKIRFFSKWFMSVAVGGALVGGLVAGAMIHYLPPNLDQRTKEKINAGELFETAWPKLEKKEKEKILELYKARTTGK